MEDKNVLNNEELEKVTGGAEEADLEFVRLIVGKVSVLEVMVEDCPGTRIKVRTNLKEEAMLHHWDAIRSYCKKVIMNKKDINVQQAAQELLNLLEGK